MLRTLLLRWLKDNDGNCIALLQYHSVIYYAYGAPTTAHLLLTGDARVVVTVVAEVVVAVVLDFADFPPVVSAFGVLTDAPAGLATTD